MPSVAAMPSTRSACCSGLLEDLPAQYIYTMLARQVRLLIHGA